MSATRLVLAVDCGGTKVEAALVDGNGTIVAGSRFRCPTGSERSAEELAGQVRSVVEQALAQLPSGSELAGIGIGTAGPIDLEQGYVSPVNLKAWREFPLRTIVVSAVRDAGYDVDTVLRLDGLCIALAEHWVGAAKGRRSVLGMIVSTGIGGGLVISDRMAVGLRGNAGHVGQMEVVGFAEDESCSTLEEIASGPSTVEWARRQGWTGATGEELADAYGLADPIAVAAVERSGLAIGRAIASVSTLLDLDAVVIGGGFARVTPDLFGFIREGVRRHARFDYARAVEVLPTGLSDEGPLIGASGLIWRADRIIG